MLEIERERAKMRETLMKVRPIPQVVQSERFITEGASYPRGFFGGVMRGPPRRAQPYYYEEEYYPERRETSRKRRDSSSDSRDRKKKKKKQYIVSL
jgi:hypothetical protein